MSLDSVVLLSICSISMLLHLLPCNRSYHSLITFCFIDWICFLFGSTYSGCLIQVESHSIWLFVSSFFHLMSRSQGSSELWYGSVLPFFYWLQNIPLCGCITVCLPVHPFMDSWVVSIVWLLYNNEAMNKYLFDALVSVLLDV